jgi:4'-phosphopantetheinyl transferase EntD
MIENLLPTVAACVAVWGDDPKADLLPEEEVQLGQVVEARRREFATARTCARLALRKLGLPVSPILRGVEREPLWPPGVTGSITHCRGYRAAAVARQADVLALGIDVEIHDQLPAEVLEQISAEQERVWLSEAPEGIHWDRLMFSAKESVYKAWFPLTHQWLDFQDVMVTFDPVKGAFYAQLLIARPVIAGCDLTDFTGAFLVQDGFVFTTTALIPRSVA